MVKICLFSGTSKSLSQVLWLWSSQAFSMNVHSKQMHCSPDASTRITKSHYNRNVLWIACIRICLFKMDAEYPLCVYFSSSLISNRKLLQEFFCNQGRGSKGKQIKKCPCKQWHFQVTMNLYTVCTNLWKVSIVRLVLHYFWKLGGVPPLPDISKSLLLSVQGSQAIPSPGWYLHVCLLFQGSDLTTVMFKQRLWEWAFPLCLSLRLVGNRLSALRYALCSVLADSVQVTWMHKHTREHNSCSDKLDMAYNRTCPAALVSGLFSDKL